VIRGLVVQRYTPMGRVAVGRNYPSTKIGHVFRPIGATQEIRDAETT
jgi:hypothetical protein